jgi:hypothetical protein
MASMPSAEEQRLAFGSLQAKDPALAVNPVTQFANGTLINAENADIFL